MNRNGELGFGIRLLWFFRQSKEKKQLQARLEKYGQAELLRFWPVLSSKQRRQLVNDIERLSLESVSRLIDECIHHPEARFKLAKNIQPIDPVLFSTGNHSPHIISKGEDWIRAGKVGLVTVAGGLGTRLGVVIPKGTLEVSPIRKKSLFQLFAEEIRAASQKFNAELPWFIMTSPHNDRDTRSFFESNNYFGLPAKLVRFFVQGTMPSFDRRGKILLKEKHRVAFSPDGHGGTLLAMKRSGVLDEMRSRGVETISYFQVDNPLVKAVDPLFIGLHLNERSEFSSKAVCKSNDSERVGNFVIGDGKVQIIEYSDFPDELAQAKNSRGQRLFNSANIAVHLVNRDLIERLTEHDAHFGLPWHRAFKQVSYVDPLGNDVQPLGANAIKFETFIFDAIPLAEKAIVVETDRAEEFSPIKNKEGGDSLATAQRDMVRRAAKWCEAAGIAVPRRPDGEPNAVIEISPLLASDMAEFVSKYNKLIKLEPRASYYLD